MTARLMIDLAGVALDSEDRSLLARKEVGGLILFSRNYRNAKQLKRLINEVRETNSGVLIAVDQEGGRVQRFQDGFHRLPTLEKIGQIAEEDEQQGLLAARSLAWLMAVELIRYGVDISFAPVLDLSLVTSKVIGDRSFGHSPNLVTKMARAYIQGMHAAGMAVTGKHFPGHGGVEADSHLELPVDHREFGQIWNLDMVPYRELLGDIDAVMSAHIRFDKIDEQLVSFSPHWLKDVLRYQMGFKGRVFSDDLTMEGAAIAGDYVERTRLALEAGCDMLVLCNNRDGALEVADWLAAQPNLEPVDWTQMRAQRHWEDDSITDHPWYEEAQEFLDFINAKKYE